jgi:hypothetical protein
VVMRAPWLRRDLALSGDGQVDDEGRGGPGRDRDGSARPATGSPGPVRRSVSSPSRLVMATALAGAPAAVASGSRGNEDTSTVCWRSRRPKQRGHAEIHLSVGEHRPGRGVSRSSRTPRGAVPPRPGGPAEPRRSPGPVAAGRRRLVGSPSPGWRRRARGPLAATHAAARPGRLLVGVVLEGDDLPVTQSVLEHRAKVGGSGDHRTRPGVGAQPASQLRGLLPGQGWGIR